MYFLYWYFLRNRNQLRLPYIHTLSLSLSFSLSLCYFLGDENCCRNKNWVQICGSFIKSSYGNERRLNVLGKAKYWSLLFNAIICSQADWIRSCRTWIFEWVTAAFTARLFSIYRSDVLTALSSFCMAGATICVHHTTMHQFTMPFYSKPYA